MSKNHANWLFLISIKAEDNKKLQCYVCAKFFQNDKFKAYIQFRTTYTYICEIFLENLLEPKRTQVFQLKLPYQNVLSDLFKNKSVKA